MNSDEIRAKIAELEAEAERQAQADPPRGRAGGSGSTGRSSSGSDPWDLLFDAALLGGDGGDEFSLNGWLVDGLRGLRTYVRSAGLNEEFWDHMHGAERELLLAARALIDARIELVEQRSKKPAETSRLQEIDIDF